MQEILRTENLTKRFGETFSLKGIDLTVMQGDIFGIIGMSGAGKSTLIRCLASLVKPSEGRIFFNQEELTALEGAMLRRARKNMGMIFQHFNLFSSRTALENITYPLEIDGMEATKRVQRGRELLERVGLKAKEKHYPASLSGGEKQRVAIARAIARNPMLLLCDEPTSALDPRTTHSILELLYQLNKDLGLTIILITHEMEVIKQISSDVAVLEHGEIVEQGKSADLFLAPKHPTTKRFLQNLTHLVPPQFMQSEPNRELLRLSFRGEEAAQPVICHLIRRFNVDINILLGGIDLLKNESVGCLVIALSGVSEERIKACQFLEECGVRWEKVAE